MKGRKKTKHIEWALDRKQATDLYWKNRPLVVSIPIQRMNEDWTCDIKYRTIAVNLFSLLDALWISYDEYVRLKRWTLSLQKAKEHQVLAREVTMLKKRLDTTAEQRKTFRTQSIVQRYQNLTKEERKASLVVNAVPQKRKRGRPRKVQPNLMENLYGIDINDDIKQ